MNTQNDIVLIYLDDVRDPPDDKWIVARSASFAHHVILMAYQMGRDMTVSLDHDLGEDTPTGYDLLNWIEKDMMTMDDFRPIIEFRIHSANPVGCDNMARAIAAIKRIAS